VRFLRVGLVRVGVALALVAGWLAGGVATAPAASAAACSGSTGVTVVVDFAALGGGIRVGCAAGSPSSGLDALQAAGFSYTTVPGQFGFVCQINLLPPDPCNGVPPPNLYWSYWHAQRGGSWTYSSEGAGTFTPPPGSVEGWAFGAGKQPGIAPPARPAPPPTTSTPRPTTAAPTTARPTTTRPTTAGPNAAAAGSSGTALPGTQAGAGSASGTGRPATSTRAGAHPASSTPSGTGSPAATATVTSPPDSPSAGDGTGPPGNAADQRPAGISPGLVVGLMLIATLVGLTLLTRRRRARNSA
jgi:hypothetical protein